MEKAIGVVLDVSLSHEDDGRRRLDKVKEQLVKFIKDVVSDGEDIFYLYHPEITEVMRKNGDEVSAISNYETDGWKFNLNYALKQTLYVIGAEDPDQYRAVVLVTDRIEDATSIKKFITLNETGDYECDLLIFAIGDRYDRNILESGEGYWYTPLENALYFAEALKEVINGREPNV